MLRLLIVAVASISAVLGTAFSLVHHSSVVFPFLYILPIICMVYFYPRRAVLFTLVLSVVFIGLVYTLGALDPFLVAVSTAWFAIFITLAVVASSYANGINAERTRIRYLMENTPNGFFCFNPATLHFLRINSMFAQWLSYTREELESEPLSTVWTDAGTRQRFVGEAREQKDGATVETLFRQKNGGMIRCIISPLYVTRDAILCSAVNVTDAQVADEEIRQTLEDLERQVREHTAHLERMNEELRAEIIEHRRLEQTLLSGTDSDGAGRQKEREP